MKKPQIALLFVAIMSFVLVGGALYFQIVERMLPCPLCILQRYMLIVTAAACLGALGTSELKRKIASSIAILAILIGAGIAIHQLWVIAHPEVSCGIDPVQTFVNNLPFAGWLPVVFEADGMCGTPYDPFLGLSLPQWSLTWFVAFLITVLAQLLMQSGSKPARS
jgi:disulfide bond formation protein DsbB